MQFLGVAVISSLLILIWESDLKWMKLNCSAPPSGLFMRRCGLEVRAHGLRANAQPPRLNSRLCWVAVVYTALRETVEEPQLWPCPLSQWEPSNHCTSFFFFAFIRCLLISALKFTQLFLGRLIKMLQCVECRVRGWSAAELSNSAKLQPCHLTRQGLCATRQLSVNHWD